MWHFKDAKVAGQHSGHIDSLDSIIGNCTFGKHAFNHIVNCFFPGLIAAIYRRRFGSDCL